MTIGPNDGRYILVRLHAVPELRVHTDRLIAALEVRDAIDRVSGWLALAKRSYGSIQAYDLAQAQACLAVAIHRSGAAHG